MHESLLSRNWPTGPLQFHYSINWHQ